MTTTLDLIKAAQSGPSGPGHRISGIDFIGRFDTPTGETADGVLKMIKDVHLAGGDRLIPMAGQLVKLEEPSRGGQEMTLAKRALTDDCPYCCKRVAVSIIGGETPGLRKVQCGECSRDWETSPELLGLAR